MYSSSEILDSYIQIIAFQIPGTIAIQHGMSRMGGPVSQECI